MRVSQAQGFMRSKKDLHKMLTEHGIEQFLAVINYFSYVSASS